MEKKIIKSLAGIEITLDNEKASYYHPVLKKEINTRYSIEYRPTEGKLLHAGDEKINGKYQNMMIRISKEVAEEIETYIKEIEKEKKQEEKRIDEKIKKQAYANCPEGYTPCRQNWSNGDLCSAEYQTSDEGLTVKILDSDLIENHMGWYYIENSKIEKAREERRAEQTKKQEAKEKEQQKEIDALKKAQETNEPQVLTSYSTDCNDPKEECSTDIITVYINPDGTKKSTRQHTW